MRRHRDKQHIKLKTALRLVTARNKLYDQKHSAPLVPVDEPYQIGVIRRLVLREDCANRSDAHAYSYALKIGTKPVSLTFRDLKSKWIIDENKQPKYRKFREKEFAHLNLHPQVAALFFRFWDEGGYYYTLRYSIRHYFVLDSNPWIVTHLRSIIPQAESEIERAWNHWRNHGYSAAYARLKGYSYREKEDTRVWRQKFHMNKEDRADFTLARAAKLNIKEFATNEPSKDLPQLTNPYEGHTEADYYHCQSLIRKP